MERGNNTLIALWDDPNDYRRHVLDILKLDGPVSGLESMTRREFAETYIGQKDQEELNPVAAIQLEHLADQYSNLTSILDIFTWGIFTKRVSYPEVTMNEESENYSSMEIKESPVLVKRTLYCVAKNKLSALENDQVQYLFGFEEFEEYPKTT